MSIPQHIHNNIWVVNNFISKDESSSIVNFVSGVIEKWEQPIIYKESRNGFVGIVDKRLFDYGLHEYYLSDLKNAIHNLVENTFKTKLKIASYHAMRWEPGQDSVPHVDTDNYDDNVYAFPQNKYSAVLYLNEDFQGGELYFPQHGIDIIPESGKLVFFPGDHTNIHGIANMVDGYRFNFVYFLDEDE